MDPMADFIELRRLTHINAIVDGYESALDHFTAVYDGVFNFHAVDTPDTRACLLTVGGVIFELFAPTDPNAQRGQGRLLARYGEHYIGAEFQVPDVAVARRKCERLGLRIINDLGNVLFTHPSDCHGISWELWDQDWHEQLSPENVDESSGWQPIPPQTYWRDEHPLGLTGLVRISVAVENLSAAIDRFTEVVGAELAYEVDRLRPSATTAGLKVGDTIIELMAPTGRGGIRDYLDRYGERIRSTVFGVTDLRCAERFLSERRIALSEGDAPDTLAIAPEQNHGLRFEISEEHSTHP